MSVVVGLLVGLAVAALAGPARHVPRSGARAHPSQRGRPTAGGGRAAGRPPSWLRARAGTGSRSGGDDLAGVLLAVAAQLRAGVAPAAAWRAVLGPAADGEVPSVAALAGAVGDGGAARSRIRAVVAGAHVACETGAPLADVLEDLAEAAAADAEQAGEVAAALAGPRATARVLTLLPVLGLLVGAAMGARPWEVLTDGLLGSALTLTGLGLVVGGRLWVAALLRRAVAT